MGADGCGWVYWCTTTTKWGNAGTGGRRHAWFGPPGGREISRHIMLKLIWRKKRGNEQQAPRTCTKRRRNHTDSLMEAKTNKQSPKTRTNDQIESPAHFAQTYHEQIINRNYAHTKRKNNKTHRKWVSIPNILLILSKQKQTRTKTSEKLAQTIKHNTCKIWRKHNVNKLAPGIIHKRK